jgi:hypothetical protein
VKKPIDDYAFKNGRQLASCNKCRDKAKIQRQSKNTEAPAENTEAPVKNTEAPVKNTEPSAKNTEASVKNTEPSAKNTEAPSATSQPKFKWVWSKDYKVQRMVRIHEEYSRRCVPSIHKYNLHHVLVDIRDTFSPSADKEYSHLNCDYYHTSLY